MSIVEVGAAPRTRLDGRALDQRVGRPLVDRDTGVHLAQEVAQVLHAGVVSLGGRGPGHQGRLRQLVSWRVEFERQRGRGVSRVWEQARVIVTDPAHPPAAARAALATA